MRKNNPMKESEPVKETKTYCQACGAGKGHNFDHCTNVSAMRRIVKDQEEEMAVLQKRFSDARQQCVDLNNLQTILTSEVRVKSALLDLIDTMRAASKTNRADQQTITHIWKHVD